MAKTALARRTTPKTRTIVRTIRAARRRAAPSAGGKAALKSAMVSTIAAGALGLAERQGISLPTVGGMPPALLWGAALALLGPSVLKGNTGTMLVHAGAGLLAVGARDMAAGSSVAGGGWESPEEGAGEAVGFGGWSPA